jgi:hypothetical protein
MKMLGVQTNTLTNGMTHDTQNPSPALVLKLQHRAASQHLLCIRTTNPSFRKIQSSDSTSSPVKTEQHNFQILPVVFMYIYDWESLVQNFWVMVSELRLFKRFLCTLVILPWHIHFPGSILSISMLKPIHSSQLLYDKSTFIIPIFQTGKLRCENIKPPEVCGVYF